ncbi:MAG TPA: hypothetical protein P5205_02555 [Candidatus Paceibacterota bacterium]|nr:hypothetical protein [Verrucomicrobiota bacterium]HSA09228.1 hypothetical protein [Candidatus Paceibacterota bacterium]
MTTEGKQRLGLLPLLLMGMASLLAGVWGGLVRIPLNLPLPGGNANWLTFHGPLMVCGFLGTVIGLERAVGLRGWWPYIAPLLTGAGSAMVMAGALGRVPMLLITAGSLWFWAVSLWVVRLQRATFTVVMSAGALAWAVGNLLWRADWPISRVVPWWIAFLTLTIVGERLDLSRFQKPSRYSTPLLYGTLGLFGGGVILSSLSRVAGERLTGLSLLALAAWLGSFDLARRTIRQPGLPRFMAICLLAGYGWLAVAGVLMVAFFPLESGMRYDAVLHSFFLGFAFSMIFGHAPVIFPAVLVLQPSFRAAFYSHVLLLHLAVTLRVGSEVVKWPPGREWGGIASALAVGLFLINTVTSFTLRPGPGTKSSRKG